MVKGLEAESDPNLLVGFATSDDAGVYLLQDGMALVQTVDFITAVVDDPEVFGQVAAANALSDVYAMGGRPLTALNICCFPSRGIDRASLAGILRGGASKIREAGAALVGGHTVQDPDLKYGLSVTGIVDPRRVVRNSTAVPVIAHVSSSSCPSFRSTDNGSSHRVAFPWGLKRFETARLGFRLNGEPLPLKHGYPLRALALGWTGANCVKWLSRIVVLERPYEGFFMDKVYRVFQRGQDSKTGEVVTGLKLKSIITQPRPGATLPAGRIVVLGAAYGGESDVDRVDLSLDGGASWEPAEFIGPHEPFAWRQWQFLWTVRNPGSYTVMARAVDTQGRLQPLRSEWNVLGYGTNGVHEHAVDVVIL